jgi:hypothetical protein
VPPPDWRGEQVFEIFAAEARTLAATAAGIGVALAGAGIGVVAIRARRRLLGAGFVDLAAVEPGALFGVRQQLVGGGHRFELLLGGLIAGVQVRVELFRELAVGLADVIRARGFLHAQDFVRVFCHEVSLA